MSCCVLFRSSGQLLFLLGRVAWAKRFSEYGVFFFSVNFLHELSVFNFGEAILANLDGIKSQNFPGRRPYHGGAILKDFFVAMAL